MMQELLPKEVQIIATHPLFGPQSGKNGIQGLKIVLCEVRSQQFQSVKEFLEEKLGLHVLVRTPQEHDHEMAYVQGLSHFISRGLQAMNVPDGEQKTQSYQHLLDMNQMLRNDTYELFLTLENGNPYAREVRKKFLQELQKIDSDLE
jgi:prephenate dehydrogenase